MVCSAHEEESGQDEDSVAIQDVTDNPAAQADLDNTDQHSIVEPDPDSLVRPHNLCSVLVVSYEHMIR